MPNQILKNSDVSKVSWCDVQLYSFKWENSGRDLELDFIGYSISDSKEEALYNMRCSWVSGVTIHLIYKDNHGGFPMTWDANFEQEKNGNLKVSFDFAGTGKISFNCTEIKLEVSSSTPT